MLKLKLSSLLIPAMCMSVSLAAFAVKSDLQSPAFAETPDVANIQAAYDMLAVPGNTTHDKDVKIVEARCYQKKDKPDEYGCFVSYMNRRDADQRLYFDVAEVADAHGVWLLKSGICKRQTL